MTMSIMVLGCAFACLQVQEISESLSRRLASGANLSIDGSIGQHCVLLSGCHNTQPCWERSASRFTQTFLAGTLSLGNRLQYLHGLTKGLVGMICLPVMLSVGARCSANKSAPRKPRFARVEQSGKPKPYSAPSERSLARAAHTRKSIREKQEGARVSRGPAFVDGTIHHMARIIESPQPLRCAVVGLACARLANGQGGRKATRDSRPTVQRTMRGVQRCAS